MNGLPSVDDLRGDLAAVLARFRAGRTRAFSFGDGTPEAVVLTYDEFEDFGGEAKFEILGEVLEPSVLSERLRGLVEAVRAGRAVPVVWGEGGEPEAVVMSTAQYRELRGDDQPSAGVVDDPTVRTYASEPMPGSRPLDLDEWAAAMGPETQEILEELRREDREGS
jgi:PHD/YefM family antitoxin component YafN of YafNO toxin-antitoxin module